MKKVQGLAVSKVLFATLSISLIVVGIAQAQMDLPVFTGKFTLTSQVEWGDAVLQPGDYTIIIESSSTLTVAQIRDGKGRAAGFVLGIDAGKTSARNALQVKQKGGRLRVYALELASLGRTLVYDRALAREAVLESRAPQTVPVIVAKR